MSRRRIRRGGRGGGEASTREIVALDSRWLTNKRGNRFRALAASKSRRNYTGFNSRGPRRSAGNVFADRTKLSTVRANEWRTLIQRCLPSNRSSISRSIGRKARLTAATSDQHVDIIPPDERERDLYVPPPCFSKDSNVRAGGRAKGRMDGKIVRRYGRKARERKS